MALVVQRQSATLREERRPGNLRYLDAAITERLMRRIRTDFGDWADHVAQLLADVESGNQGRERVLAAAVLGARGDLHTLEKLIELSHIDWRDLLVAGGLAHAGWARVLTDELGLPD